MNGQIAPGIGLAGKAVPLVKFLAAQEAPLYRVH